MLVCMTKNKRYVPEPEVPEELKERDRVIRAVLAKELSVTDGAEKLGPLTQSLSNAASPSDGGNARGDDTEGGGPAGDAAGGSGACGGERALEAGEPAPAGPRGDDRSPLGSGGGGGGGAGARARAAPPHQTPHHPHPQGKSHRTSH